MNKFKKFTSIEKFSDVWEKAQKYDLGKKLLRSKIKLHGTNAGVRIADGVVTAQKRTSDVTIEHDNAGFAQWVSTVNWKRDQNVIIYGEWAGPGVQKSDAISLIEGNRFFVFGVLLLDLATLPKDWENPVANYVIEPELIKEYLPEHQNIFVLPWFDSPMPLDSNRVQTARDIQYRVEAQIEAIGNEDPYVKAEFGISGSGEGLVIAPYDESGIVNIDVYNTYVFKVKSEAHAVKKTKNPAAIRTEVPDSVKDFANTFVTHARCQQMLDENCEGSLSPKVIGSFLKALNQDILKESKAELAEMEVEWKLIAKEINRKAVAWFNRQNKI